jgi:filamentous hemagglutinin family protein
MAKVWQYKNWQMVLASTLAVSATLIIPATDAFAQNITLDGSLGTAGTLTGPNYVIPQSVGQAAGNNLFHSFGKFNLNTNEAAIFQSADNIRNILSRVTGGTASSIDGLIRTENSNVNFFLMNPSGIIFGRNARLDVSGSFVASTANAMQFGDRGFFSATSPETPSPLLTVNPSAFFFNQLQPGRIENNSTAPIGNNFSGLRVPDGRSLLLVGGDITIDGGRLYAPGGRVELAGIAGNGAVGLNVDGKNLILTIPDGVALANVSLTNTARVNVRAGDGGSIAINARNLHISGGSFLLAGIADDLGSSSSQAGDITLNITEQIKLEQESGIGNEVRFDATGNSGDINISTGSLSLTDSVLSTSTIGKGNAGSVFMQAKNSVSITGNKTRISTGVLRNGVGKGGDINIRAASLSVKDGAQLVSAISVAGRGDAGNINIVVTGAVIIVGLNEIPSGLYSLVSREGIGNGGNITISAASFSLLDGANVFANTNGEGDAGTIQINATDFVSISGASTTRGDSSEISARTNSLNRGGDIIINTRNFRLSNGAVMNSQTLNDGDGGNIILNARRVEVINGGQFLSNTSGKGNAGKITVNATEQLTVDGIDRTLSNRIARYAQSGQTRGIINLGNGASGFFVLSQGSGSAGDIEVISPKIQLDNTGRLIADSASGNGGNIRVQAGDLLLLRHGSLISATAGTAQAGGDGGNIDIDTGFIVAIPEENSDITANAFSGEGGRVDITTNGIFGIKPQERETQESDITASSELGVSGQVTINTLEVDPSRGLVQLPSNLVDASRQIAQGCTPKGRQTASRFIATGRGGLPLSPNEPLRGRAAIASWVTLPTQATDRQANKLSTSIKGQSDTFVTKSTPQIVEAQGWVLDAKGETHLVAQSPQMTYSMPSSISCSS